MSQIEFDEVGDAVTVRVVIPITRDKWVECPDLVRRVPTCEYQFDAVEQAIAIGVGVVWIGGPPALVDLFVRQEHAE